MTLGRDETTQSFKLGCVTATKLGALVSPTPPPPPLLELPSRDTEVPPGGKLACFCPPSAPVEPGPGSGSCVSPERSRRSRRRVPVQPYLFFLSPRLFHPVLKLQLSSHNSSSDGRKTHTQHPAREQRAGLRRRLSFRGERRAALRCDAALFLEKKLIRSVCAPCFPGRSSPHSGIFVR